MEYIETNITDVIRLYEKLYIGEDFEKEIQKLIRKVLKEARGRLSADAQAALPNDPRQAYRAVKHSVYKSILGGSVSILNKKRRSGKSYPVPEQRERKGRGGNRLTRSKRTEEIMSYYGDDRGFILRFLNAGTQVRSSRYGNRGSIAARNWFPGASQKQMEVASQQLTELIEKEIQKLLK